jgi:hypothetical protein
MGLSWLKNNIKNGKISFLGQKLSSDPKNTNSIQNSDFGTR